jgi:hypothetical protein
LAASRDLSLLVQAACVGSIDFTQARLLDSRWWQGVDWKLDYLEQEDLACILSDKIDLHAACLSSARDQNTFQRHWDEVHEILQLQVGLLTPWLAKGLLSAAAVAEGLKVEWERLFGRMDDPRTQEKIQRTIQHIEERKRKANPWQPPTLRPAAPGTPTRSRLMQRLRDTRGPSKR